ncbi:helix-turn-helix transcriptional regulator [Rhodoplanes serenus]|uniref:helix-turn-helix transcriptional regulator n=1 Tax=Rhodoplanes serenus TaxID=200615 RepID=UPI00131A8D93|nr:helix-turn-helix domain-containing protein [Rhodoplanes serenus]
MTITSGGRRAAAPPPVTDFDPVLRLNQAAGLVGLSPKGLRALTARGEGPTAMRVGRFVMFRKSEIHRWLLSCEQPARKAQGGDHA